ncbi:MAG: CRISPR-associated helicase Cas3' [Desulfomonilaceae bacterium]
MKNRSQGYFGYWGKADIDYSNTKNVSYYHLLPYHGIDVASVGMALIEANKSLRKNMSKLILLDDMVFYNLVFAFLCIHDLGKFSRTFQNLRPDIVFQLSGIQTNKPYSVRHDSLGLILCRFLTKRNCRRGTDGWSQYLFNANLWSGIQMWQSATSGHHGKPASMRKPGGAKIIIDDYFSPQDIQSAESFVSDVIDILPLDRNDARLEYELFNAASKKLSWLLAGLTVLSDWIASTRSFFEYCSVPMDLSEYAAISKRRALEAIKQIGLVSRKVSVISSFSDLYPGIEKPSPLQKLSTELTGKAGPELYIIEDITGSGKTEAAISFAHRMMMDGKADGIFVGMPTMATANSMYSRLAETYQRLFQETEIPFLILSHSTSKMIDSGPGLKMPIINTEMNYGTEESAGYLCSTWIADNKKKAFLSTIGVGTLDQALLSILPSKHQSLRLVGLNTKVLIVDEAHSYDSYTSRLLNKLIEFHSGLGGSTIVLSATLDAKLKQELVTSFANGLGINSPKLSLTGFPFLTRVCKSECRQLTFEPRPDVCSEIEISFIHDPDQVTEHIIESIKSGRSVCWVRNTVFDAIESYQKLSELVDARNIILFHSRFIMGDRIEIEKNVIERFGKYSSPELRNGQLLIATQVVEQSLDLDFDSMVTDLAPIDMLIQRAGRLRRHPRDRYGKLLSPGLPDERERTPLVVFGPKFDHNPSSKWYSDFFPKGSYVYPFHGVIWSTAKILSEKGGWRFPDDARILIESVYGLDPSQLPEAIDRRDRQAEGESKAERAMADLNSLSLEEGYSSKIMGAWLEDTLTPTRLGELRSILRLARWDNNVVVPLVCFESHAWAMNEVSVNAFIASEQCEIISPDGVEIIDQVKDQMPDKLKWSILTLMKENESGFWEGKAQNMNGREVTILYSKTLGLTYET